MSTPLRVLFAGGGTAGHINPALTVADVLHAEGANILFAGTPTGLEGDLVPRAGYTLKPIRVHPLPRKLNLRLVKAVGEAGIGVGQALSVLRSFRPNVVVGTGGYVAGPVLLAAVLLRVPTVIHEQNAYPGGTNRTLARWVTRVALGYNEAAQYFPGPDKLVFVGNPIHADFFSARRSEGLDRLLLRRDRLTVIIFGGSRGARSINEAVFAARHRLQAMKSVQVVHQTGATGFDDVVAAYRSQGITPADKNLIQDQNIRVVPYLYDMPSTLAAADLVVSRSGALSVAEITACGLPAILVPYPYATADHQTFNARPLVDAGAARCIPDNKLDGDTLADFIHKLIQDPEGLRKMGKRAKALGQPDAATKLVDLIRSVAAGQA